MRKRISKVKKYFKMKISIFPFICIFSFFSCNDNEIYFDIKNQKIMTCNRHPIRFLTITNKDTTHLFFEIIKEKGEKGENFLTLNKIKDPYLVIDRYQDTVNFELTPFSTYKIENSTFGDATSSIIIVKTDKDGQIVYSSKTDCTK